MSQSKSSSSSVTPNYSGVQTSGGNSPIIQGSKRVVLGNETSVVNKNKVNAATNSNNKTSVKNKGGTINYVTNNGLSADQASSILDKLSTSLGGSSDSGSGSGGTSIAYAPPPNVANESAANASTSSTVKWIIGVAAVIALAAFLFLSKRKKS